VKESADKVNSEKGIETMKELLEKLGRELINSPFMSAMLISFTLRFRWTTGMPPKCTFSCPNSLITKL